jgi:hypothetical protein
MTAAGAGADRVRSTVESLVADDVDEQRRARAGRWGRRLTVSVLLAFVAAGLTGWLGERSATLHAQHPRLRVELEHPAITRGGLPAAWRLDVATADGTAIGGVLSIETTTRYLTVFDRNDIAPEPDATWQTDTTTTWEFDAASESSLRVALDVRTQPNARWRRTATTVVRVDEVEVARFDYDTLVLP